jgi:prepilin-type N-terminal cleavage/methylation domain-containing protein
MRFFVVPPFAGLLRMTRSRAISRITWAGPFSRWTPLGNRGLTILEVLAALAILAFGLLAVATMQASSIKGNNQAIDTTEAMTVAQDKAEELMRLAYTHADLDDDDNDGTAGLYDTTGADGSEVSADPRYTVYWNVAQNSPINNVKTVQVIVVWTYKGTQKTATVDFMKSDII